MKKLLVAYFVLAIISLFAPLPMALVAFFMMIPVAVLLTRWDIDNSQIESKKEQS